MRPRLLAPRIAFFYGAYFAVAGVHLPFLPVWLAERGLAAAEVAVVVAAGILTRTLTAPFLARIADRTGERRRLMMGLAAAAAVVLALHWPARGFAPLLALTVLWAAAWAPIMPLGETLAMHTARDHGLDYGRVRLWGSLAFMVMAVVAGRLLVGRSADAVFWLVLGFLGLTTAATAALPDIRFRRPGPGVAEVEGLGGRRFAVFLAAVTLIQGSHAMFYSLGTLHWRSVGYGDDAIGWLWAEGVIVEIGLFMIGGTLVRRLGPVALMGLGGLGGTVRWTATGLSDALPVLAGAQALHALTFAATHLGAMYFLSHSVPPGRAAVAQSLYAVVTGLGIGFATLACGPLYAAVGGAAYLAMAAMTAAGGTLTLALWRAGGSRIG
jgi:PPP family 3-phenylpropionic acid transporter